MSKAVVLCMVVGNSSYVIIINYHQDFYKSSISFIGRLTLPMLRLISSKAQERKDF